MCVCVGGVVPGGALEELRLRLMSVSWALLRWGSRERLDQWVARSSPRSEPGCLDISLEVVEARSFTCSTLAPLGALTHAHMTLPTPWHSTPTAKRLRRTELMATTASANGVNGDGSGLPWLSPSVGSETSVGALRLVTAPDGTDPVPLHS